MKNLNIDKNWTLFLDRDGVVNNKLEGDYVKKWEEFIFSYKALESISKLSEVFKRIIIVTNQRGIGKGLMTEKDLVLIHNKMTKKIIDNKGLIAKIYFCSDVSNSSKFRKPNPGMALNAKLDFPEINFKKSRALIIQNGSFVNFVVTIEIEPENRFNFEKIKNEFNIFFIIFHDSLIFFS